MKTFKVHWMERHYVHVEANNEEEAYTMALNEDPEITLYNRNLVEAKELDCLLHNTPKDNEGYCKICQEEPQGDGPED